MFNEDALCGVLANDQPVQCFEETGPSCGNRGARIPGQGAGKRGRLLDAFRCRRVRIEKTDLAGGPSLQLVITLQGSQEP